LTRSHIRTYSDTGAKVFLTILQSPCFGSVVIARINRALAPQDMHLKTSRGWRMKLDVGDYYVVNTRINGIVQPYKHMDLQSIARDVGVLEDWEKVCFD
jgi:hypothetical protein